MQRNEKITNQNKCNKLITQAMLKRRKLAHSSIAKACENDFKIKLIK